jgi:hypothetical protein
MMEKRTALRFPTDLEAACRTLDKSWTARLRNISTSGCMITLPEDDLTDDAMLRLRIKGLAAIDAEVVWQHRNHAGVRFRVPLHPAALEHLGFVLPQGGLGKRRPQHAGRRTLRAGRRRSDPGAARYRRGAQWPAREAHRGSLRAGRLTAGAGCAGHREIAQGPKPAGRRPVGLQRRGRCARKR